MNYDFRSELMTKIKDNREKSFESNILFTIFSSLAGGFRKKNNIGA